MILDGMAGNNYVKWTLTRRSTSHLYNRDRGAYAPLPHHRTCGSASGGSVKYDEVRIVLENFPVQTVANKRYSKHDEPNAIWIAAKFLNSSRRFEWPSVLRPLLPLGSRVGSVASSIVSTRSVASDVASMRLASPYVLDYLPSHNSSPIR